MLALLDHAADPTADAVAVPEVSERHIENAWRLVAYFKSHARRVYAVVNLGTATHEAVAAKAIVSWLRDGSHDVHQRDAKQARRWIEPECWPKPCLTWPKRTPFAPKRPCKGPPNPAVHRRPSMT